MGIWRYPLHRMYHLRSQICWNAQLVPTYQDQPANEHTRRVLAAWPLLLICSLFLFLLSLFPFLLLAYLPRVTIRVEARFLILRVKPHLFENNIFIFSQAVN